MNSQGITSFCLLSARAKGTGYHGDVGNCNEHQKGDSCGHQWEAVVESGGGVGITESSVQKAMSRERLGEEVC